MNWRKSAAFLAAPLLGAILTLPFYSSFSAIAITTKSSSIKISELSDKLEQNKRMLNQISEVSMLRTSFKLEQTSIMTRVKDAIIARQQEAALIAANRISFGTLLDSSSTTSSNLKLYTYSTSKYKAYVLHIVPKNSKAVQMVLGNDKVGGSETTLSAAKRYNAVAGINAGGFADSGGKRYPLLNTLYHDSFIGGFETKVSIKKNVAFIGFNTNMKLIGGVFTSESQLRKLNPKFGASFVPQLLKDGKKLTIPSPWNTSPLRAPRTILASLKDGSTIAIVTDGYNEKGSSGATLAELQTKLLSFGAVNAFNLDGGGSSSLIFKGKIINHPSDGSLRKLPTHFLFY
jgi:hypothetical protein